MITQAAQDPGMFGDGFGPGTVLLIVGMVVALAVVSGLGVIARMYERADGRRALRVRAAHEARPAGDDQ